MRRLLLLLLLFALPVSSVAQSDPASPEPASPVLDKAEVAITKSDWKAASPILDTWLAAHPADARALFDSAYIADAQSRNDEAVTLYRRSLEADPKHFLAQISLGLLLARTNHPEEARPELLKATTLDAANPAAKARAWRALARIDLASPDVVAASDDLLQALKLTPETPDDALMAARLADMTNEDSAAEKAYRRVLQAQPDSPEAIAGLAHLLIAQKKYPEAQALLKPALDKSPTDPALTAQMAAVLVAQDDAGALPLLQQFHKSHPQDTTITRMLAKVLADAGEYADSDQFYITLLSATPGDADLLAGHGQNLIRLNRYPEALKAFQQATDLDETNGQAWNGLAFAAFKTHQPEVTLHALTVRSKYLPENASIDFLWATAYDTLHDKKSAAAYYHRFLDSSGGKFPDQEWQARQRLALLEKTP